MALLPAWNYDGTNKSASSKHFELALYWTRLPTHPPAHNSEFSVSARAQQDLDMHNDAFAKAAVKILLDQTPLPLQMSRSAMGSNRPADSYT